MEISKKYNTIDLEVHQQNLGGVHNTISSHRKSKNKSGRDLCGDAEEESGIPPPPELPVNSKAPWINIPTSSFAKHWEKMVNNSDHADVEFLVGDCTYHAHRLVLCSACEFFWRLFGIETKLKTESLAECPGWSKKKLEKITPDGVNLGMVEGVTSFSVM